MGKPNSTLVSETDQVAFPFILQIIRLGEALEKTEQV